MIGDLHCHTRLSDSSISIDDLIFYAKRAGLDAIAVTDHDTMDGVTRAAVLGKRYGLTVVPGMELSAYDYSRGNKVHILCYLPQKPDRLQGLLSQILESRNRAGKKMIRAVMHYYPVTEEHIMRYAAGSKAVYKVHIMQALLDLGYDNRPYGELFQTLFHPETGLCFRPVEYPDVREALKAVGEAGGVAVMAHPPVYKGMELLEELAGEGWLDGVEAYHPRVGPPERRRIEELAHSHGLFLTGGSDFHGSAAADPCPLASCITTEQGLQALFARSKQK